MKWSELWVGNVTGVERCLPSILSHSLSDSPTRTLLSTTNFYSHIFWVNLDNLGNFIVHSHSLSDSPHILFFQAPTLDMLH
jgi:hypothetical protein